MAEKATPNPTAVPLQPAAPAEAVEPPAPAPVQEVEQLLHKIADAPEVAPQPAAPVAKVAEEPGQPEPEPVKPPITFVTSAQPEPELVPVMFAAPVHDRTKKKNSSQMSVQVPPDLFEVVDEARKEIRGLTGQTILMEGLIMWLTHNRFLTPEKAAETLRKMQLK
jgi:hypothetical protein